MTTYLVLYSHPRGLYSFLNILWLEVGVRFSIDIIVASSSNHENPTLLGYAVLNNTNDCSDHIMPQHCCSLGMLLHQLSKQVYNYILGSTATHF